MIVRVFEVQNTTDGTMENQVKILLDSFGLFNKVITYVKNESSNLNTLTNDLKFVVSCSPLQLSTPFVKPCNVKSSYYATNDTKRFQDFSKLNLKII